jgi:uncharacterized protein
MSTEVLEKRTTRIPVSQAANQFLASKRIAVTGVSRHPEEGHGANFVYKRLRERGYAVFAINPNATEVEGDESYPDLRSIPDGVDAVLIGTRPEAAMDTVKECGELGVRQIWMHGSVGGRSVSHEAAEYGREHGLNVIEGGCPLMFEPVSDGAHKVMRFMLTLTGQVPRRVEAPQPR